MAWDNDAKVAFLLRLPWTIDRTIEDGEIVLQVREVPDALAQDADSETVERELWESLKASLHARIHFGDSLPRPAGARVILPWESGFPRSIGNKVLVIHTGEHAAITEDRSITASVASIPQGEFVSA